MNDSDNREFERRSRELFEADVAGLDAATRSKLNQARQRALAQIDHPSATFVRTQLPQAAAAAVAVAAIGSFLWLRGADAPGPEADVAAVTDLEILTAEEDMAFIEELEFYAWLEAQPEFSDLADSGEGAG